LKQLQTHFKAKHETGVVTPPARVPAPLHPWSQAFGKCNPSELGKIQADRESDNLPCVRRSQLHKA